MRSTADIGRASSSKFKSVDNLESEMRRPLTRIATRPLPRTNGRRRPKLLYFNRLSSRSRTFFMPDSSISVRSMTAMGCTASAAATGMWPATCRISSACVATAVVAMINKAASARDIA